MITVYSELMKFCVNQGPEVVINPQKKDISNLGKQVSSDFKTIWVPGAASTAPQLFTTQQAIVDTGMIYEEQDGGLFTVNGYPDLYRERMLGIFKKYFNVSDQKNNPKKRKRVPVKGVKVAVNFK